MYFSSNLQILRKRCGMTQEKLADRLGVSRQAISKWESGETVPEISTLLQLAQLFSCTLDDLLQQDLSFPRSPVQIVTVKGFRMAKYRVISPNARQDVLTLLDHWAAGQGLVQPTILFWRFPYVTEEQQHRFSLEGFEAACVLPERFTPAASAIPITCQTDCTYAMLTLEDPSSHRRSQIPQGIRAIVEALQEKGIRKTAEEGFLPAFERCVVRDGKTVTELYLQCRNAPSTKEIQL